MHSPRPCSSAPQGYLFVPITGNGPDSGSVRRYNVATQTFDVFVPPNAADGSMVQPWYLTFGKTNPATLVYEGHSATKLGRPCREPRTVRNITTKDAKGTKESGNTESW